MPHSPLLSWSDCALSTLMIHSSSRATQYMNSIVHMMKRQPRRRGMFETTFSGAQNTDRIASRNQLHLSHEQAPHLAPVDVCNLRGAPAVHSPPSAQTFCPLEHWCTVHPSVVPYLPLESPRNARTRYPKPSSTPFIRGRVSVLGTASRALHLGSSQLCARSWQ